MNTFHICVLSLVLGLTVAKTAPTPHDIPSNDEDATGLGRNAIEPIDGKTLGQTADSAKEDDGGWDDMDDQNSPESSVDPPFVNTEIIRMNNVIPEEDDMNICTGVSMGADSSWIVGYVPLPQNESVDMITLYGCLEKPDVSFKTWSCNPDLERTVCNSPSVMLYRWTRTCDMISAQKQEVLIVGGAYLRDMVLMVHYKDGQIKDSSALELKLLSGEYTETDAHYLSKYYSQFVEPHCDETMYDLSRLLANLPMLGESYDMAYDYSDVSKQSDYQVNSIETSLDEVYSSLGSAWEYSPVLVQDLSWPAPGLNLGQVSGVDAHPKTGDVFVFHRADRPWQPSDFDENHIFVNAEERGPIRENVILLLSKNGGDIKQQSGSDRFYMPHGLTCDSNGDLWLTDVALHQVFKVSGKNFKTEMVLGEAFVPGVDHKHFCQPTDVAVEISTGNVFIADGYCNKRILKFSSNGTFIQEITAHGDSSDPRRSSFNIPHSLALVESRQMICVADRENGRIQCFDTVTGDFIKEIRKREFGGRVFAIAYIYILDVLYAVNGQSERVPAQGYTIDVSTGEILETWAPHQEFQMPHDIAVGPDGNYVYVGDVIDQQVVRFLREEYNNNI
ncbi:peptidylglycine alpha-amidating monooxygenase-like [Anneissia japonica]|uniref:peptidylglycine alpha-amidating monooxygenase-like n=1 Tax=Anneissia japonica TaxID=1529436 RepID=UPI001425ACCA|nr:peptidylglycine alpha-amidating monooxygenase-like [Anneissia japonica]